MGSGPGGGIATYVLCRAGLKVALVEAGKRLRAGVDYNAHWNVYEKLEERLKQGLNPVSSVWRDFASRDHFTGVGHNPGHGLLRALGGRSLCWAGHSLRFGPGDFRQWPISYDEVKPYYDRAEAFMGVHGEKNGLWNLPDGVFQKKVPIRCAERMLQIGVERLKGKGAKMEFVPQRKAIPTEKHSSGRAVCHYCGHCMQGCEVDSKYTSANTPIPRALRTGNLTLLTESTMTRILTKEGRATGIEYQDSKGEVIEIGCRALVLACNSIETPRQLLASGVANSSGQVGRNLTSHFGVTVIADFPQLYRRDVSNDDGTDYYHSLLTGLYWDSPGRNFEGTYQVQCASGMHPQRVGVKDVPGFGAGFRKRLKEVNAGHANMNMQGTTLRSAKKYVDLDPERKDRHGIPLPRVHLHYEDSDLAMARDMVETCERVIEAAGGKVWSTPGEITPAKLVIDQNHWVGTARMGTDPKTSVVDIRGRSHDVPNLFINDASIFPAYPEKNPTLTNITLSWRTADGIVERFKRREI